MTSDKKSLSAKKQSASEIQSNKAQSNSTLNQQPISEEVKKSVKEQERLHLNLGYILGLFSASKYHVKASVGHFMASVIPAVKNEQFRIFFKGFKPVAYLSWACLSNEIADKYKQGNYPLKMEEWKTGENIWLIEFIAPYSDEDRQAVIKNFKEQTFPNKTVNVIVRNADGSLKEVIQDFRKNADA